MVGALLAAPVIIVIAMWFVLGHTLTDPTPWPFVIAVVAIEEDATVRLTTNIVGDGPLEVTKEGRGIVMRVPLEGGGRLVVELNADQARREKAVVGKSVAFQLPH